MTSHMIHPGPRATKRVIAVPCSPRAISGPVRKGQSVMEAVAEIFARHQCKGGVMKLHGLKLDPIHYVLPALSTDGLHAAWYSETHTPKGCFTVKRATATVGWRHGAPFLHCHGLWQGPDGTAMGHLLPHASTIAEDGILHGVGMTEAWFEAVSDQETAFTLFSPQGAENGAGVLARLLPGEDVITAIEALAAKFGITYARLHAVGSIDHVVFANGQRMDCLATELHFLDARLHAGRAEIEIEVVDITGRIMRGRLAAGHNPVGVTLELLIEPIGQDI